MMLNHRTEIKLCCVYTILRVRVCFYITFPFVFVMFWVAKVHLQSVLKTYCLLTSPQWHMKSIQTDVHDIYTSLSPLILPVWYWHAPSDWMRSVFRFSLRCSVRCFFFFQLWALLRSLMENQKLLHLLFNSDQRSAERWTIWRKISLRTSLHVATSITKFTPHSMKIPPLFSSVGTASAGYRLLGYNRCRVWNSAQRGQFLLHDIRESIKHRESFRCCLANQINTPFTQSCYLLAAPRWKHDL